jgi:hypothetical protein
MVEDKVGKGNGLWITFLFMGWFWAWAPPFAITDHSYENLGLKL